MLLLAYKTVRLNTSAEYKLKNIISLIKMSPLAILPTIVFEFDLSFTTRIPNFYKEEVVIYARTYSNIWKW